MKDTWIIIATFNDRNPGKIIEKFIVQASNENDAISLAKAEASFTYYHIRNFKVQECNCYSKNEVNLIIEISGLQTTQGKEWSIVKIEGKSAAFTGRFFQTKEGAESVCMQMNKEEDIATVYYVVVPVKVSREVIS